MTGVHHVTRANAGSRTVIDNAVGILVALRGCTPEDAFGELVDVVRQTGVGIGVLAAGLVALATGRSTAQDAEAFNAWGALIARQRATVRPDGR